MSPSLKAIIDYYLRSVVDTIHGRDISQKRLSYFSGKKKKIGKNV